jgi:Na+/H+ antiporter NhaA
LPYKFIAFIDDLFSAIVMKRIFYSSDHGFDVLMVRTLALNLLLAIAGITDLSVV